MPQYEPNTRGDLQDRVRLVLGGDELIITEGYDVRQGVLTQPSAFSLRLGHGGVARDIFEKYPPRTKFQLYIGDALRMTGFTDGFVSADTNGACEVTFSGRDVLARLHDAYVHADKSYSNRTYGDLVLTIIKDALGEATVVADTNVFNRLTLAGLSGASGAGGGQPTPTVPATFGIDVIGIVDPAVVAKAKAEQQAKLAAMAAGSASGSSPAAASTTMLAKAGEKYYEFLKKELDRAGLCMFASADGENVILMSPDGQQPPIARLVRRRGTTGNIVNVESARYVVDTAKRFSEVIIYARGGGGAAGRTTSNARYVDDEMIKWGFGPEKALVIRDHKCKHAKQAEYLARRKMAESRRAGTQYSVTVAGHTFPVLGTGERGVWCHDTVVDVDDDENGIHGPWYVEQVAFKRDTKTTTELTLLEPKTLIFSEDPPQ